MIEEGDFRENTSYAVGDPYGIFSYIPHTLLPDGSVVLSQDAIEKMWRLTHSWEPMPGWRESRVKQADLHEGDRVQKYDPSLGWVPGTMVIVSHNGKDDLQFKADSGQYAPSPTWPDSRFRKLEESE